jgi:NitT/TauT family transport system permease protein
MRNRKLEMLMPWLVVIGLFLVWEIACVAFAVPEFVLPRPSVVLTVLYNTAGPIWYHASHTLFTTMVGFALAVIGGMLLGVAVGSSPLVYNGLYPVLIGFNSIPKVALVPVLVVWFGIGTVPAILTAFLISFFPIAVNVATGLATLEPELEDVLRSLGATRTDILRKVGLPRSLPYFYGSLKIAITLAFVGTVLAEMTAGDSGIGNLIQSAGSQQRMPLAFAGLVTISVMAMAMYELFSAIEKHTTAWAHRGSQAG